MGYPYPCFCPLQGDPLPHLSGQGSQAAHHIHSQLSLG